jgi:hypothetical protein
MGKRDCCEAYCNTDFLTVADKVVLLSTDWNVLLLVFGGV